jgi:Tol biopolymer transport system component
MYMSANAGGRFHIWRQRFPKGEPEQVTSGTTEEEGIAMAGDGKSMLTSVGTTDAALWIHDEKGERQISEEGTTFAGTFSEDGKKLYYLKKSGGESKIELWSTDLETGRSERVVPGYEVESGFDAQNYAVSPDGEKVVFVRKDEKGISHLWVASTDHRKSPEQLASDGNEDSPNFTLGGDLIYRASENGKNYLYRRKLDGSGRQRLMDTDLFSVGTVSPDGRWTMVGLKQDQDQKYPIHVMAYPNGGGSPVVVCRTLCIAGWSVDGKFFQVQIGANREWESFLLPIKKETGLPELPKEGLEESKELKGIVKFPLGGADTVMGPEKYAYTKINVRRNIYRVPLE